MKITERILIFVLHVWKVLHVALLLSMSSPHMKTPFLQSVQFFNFEFWILTALLKSWLTIKIELTERENQAGERWEEAPVMRMMDWEEELGLMLKTKFCSSMSRRWGKISRETGELVSILRTSFLSYNAWMFIKYALFGAGLKRYGNHCRLRRLNYQKPDIKRGNITEDEEDLIIRLHKLLGNRYLLLVLKPCKLR